jgi:hypothetical protein
MQDKTITNVLLALRTQIIRGRLDRLAHVDALLVARGIDPAKLRVRAKRKPDFSRKGIMRLIVAEALQEGLKRHPEVAALVAPGRPEIGPQAVYKRTGQALDKMQKAGLVKREGRLWYLHKRHAFGFCHGDNG